MIQVLYKVRIFLVFYILSGITFAQFAEPDFEVQPTVEFENKKRELLQKLIYSNTTGHYALYGKGKNGDGQKSIRKFDTNFKPLGYRIKLSYPKDAIEPKTIDVISIDNKVYHIWSAISSKGVDYFSEEIDLLSKSIKQKTKIASLSRDVANYDSRNAKILLNRNLKQTYLFVELIKSPKEDKKLSLFVFDSRMNIMDVQNYTFPHDNKNFILKSIQPSTNDRFIVFAKWFSWEDKEKSIEAKEYSYFAYELHNNEVGLLAEIRTEGNHLTNFLAKTEDSSLFISGLLAKESPEIPVGLFFLKYDLIKKKITQEKRLSMPKSFYKYPEYLDENSSIPTKAKDIKKRAEDSYYSPKRLFISSKKEVILLTEQNSFMQMTSVGIPNYGVNQFGAGAPQMQITGFIRSNYIFDYSQSEGSGIHFRNDIAVFKFNENGELLWSNKIEKQQEWPETSKYISLYSKFVNDKLFLIYNGNYLNIEGSGDFLGKKDSALLCTVVEENGNYRRQIIHYYTAEYPNVTMPYLTHYSEKYGFLLHSRAPLNIKRQKFTRVTLN
ncbi:MAG: hypothetical protein Mars2KO_36990 [Maribacter sp.]